MKSLQETLKINCIWEVDKVEIYPTPGKKVVEVTFRNDTELSTLKIFNPTTLSFLDELMDYWDLYITDLNKTESNCLEFGRYQIEFFDEDCSTFELICDNVEYEGFGQR